jgi:Putative beta-barrel porin 2
MERRLSASGAARRRLVAANLGSRAVNAKSPWPIGLALACAISTPCVAQVSGLPTFGIQAPQITPGVDEKQIGLDLSGGYDSNVARSSEALARERGITPEDFFISPGGDVTFSRVFGRQTVFLEALAGYRAYVRNSILDRENVTLDGGAVGQVSICQTSLTGGYDRAQADLSYLLITVDGKPAPVVKDTRQDGVVDFSATCGHSIGLAPTFNVSETSVTNSNPLYAEINANVFSGSGGITYRNPVLGQVSITGQYSDATYPNRLVPVVLGTGLGFTRFGYQTVGGGISYNRAVGSRLSGTVALNYENLEPGVGQTQGFSGLTYNANLSYQVTPRLSATLVAGKETMPSNEVQASFEINQIYGAQAIYSFGPQTNVGGGVSRTRQQYEGLLVPEVLNLTEASTNSVYVNATRKLNRRLSVGASLAYSQRTANFPGLSYSDVLLTLSARSTF